MFIDDFHYQYIIDALRIAEDSERKASESRMAKADASAAVRDYIAAGYHQERADRHEADAVYYRDARIALEAAHEAERKTVEPDIDPDFVELDRILSELDELARLVNLTV